MSTQDEGSLESGRKSTDKSLRTERSKTDESISKFSEKVERHTDRAIFKSRLQSDDLRSHSRRKFDQLRTKEGDERSPSDVKDAPGNSNEQIQREREAADQSVENERLRLDTVLEEEREMKKAAETEFLHQERQATDKDLASERNETDAGVRQSADVLAKEVDAHQVTRASLATRDEFLAIVSHDLRNPLAAITMAAQILMTEPSYVEGEPEAKHFIDLIRRNADEALRLISDLLDMERIAQGKFSLEPQSHDLQQIILNALEKFEPAAEAKGLSLQFGPSATPIMAVCDSDRMTQVLANLIGNAIKFSPKGGTIIVSLNQLDGGLDISIADNGPGIQPDMQQKIFERFSQIGKEDRRGLGLGLHISKMIVEAHGGKIWVDSKVERGSTFHFTLPRNLKAEP